LFDDVIVREKNRYRENVSRNSYGCKPPKIANKKNKYKNKIIKPVTNCSLNVQAKA